MTIMVEKGWKLGDPFIPGKQKRSKMGNVPVRWKGMYFQSTHEWEDYMDLKEEEARGRIFNLERQVSYPLYSQNGKCITHYIADFRYNEGSIDGPLVVQDSKGHLTEEYKQKRKWMLADYGIKIKET